MARKKQAEEDPDLPEDQPPALTAEEQAQADERHRVPPFPDLPSPGRKRVPRYQEQLAIAATGTAPSGDPEPVE